MRGCCTKKATSFVSTTWTPVVWRGRMQADLSPRHLLLWTGRFQCVHLPAREVTPRTSSSFPIAIRLLPMTTARAIRSTKKKKNGMLQRKSEEKSRTIPAPAPPPLLPRVLLHNGDFNSSNTSWHVTVVVSPVKDFSTACSSRYHVYLLLLLLLLLRLYLHLRRHPSSLVFARHLY